MRLKIPHQMHILVCVFSAINTQLTIFKINFSYISAFSILRSAFPHFSAGSFFLSTAKLTENKTRMQNCVQFTSHRSAFPAAPALLCAENAFNLWPGPGPRTRTWRLLSAKCVCPKNWRSPTPMQSRSMYFFATGANANALAALKRRGDSRPEHWPFLTFPVNKINSFSWRAIFLL